MKNIFLLLGFICCFTLNSSLVAAQESCKVLLENISETYKGECKKGVADGNGTAKGIDSYEGDFKKGYPHGNGTMTYANGSIYMGKWKKGKREGDGIYTAKIDGEEIVQNGVWKGDKFIGKKKSQMYKVVTDMGVRNYKIRKVGDAVNQVIVEVKRNGARLRVPNSLTGDSGNYRVDQDLGVFRGTNTPFEGRMNFTVNNIGNPGTTIVNFDFIILEPGEWIVEVNISI